MRRAGYSTEEINLALEENHRQEPSVEYLQDDFLAGSDDRKTLRADPVKVDSFHKLAFKIAEDYTFAHLNGKLKVWDMQSANTPAARVTKDSSGGYFFGIAPIQMVRMLRMVLTCRLLVPFILSDITRSGVSIHDSYQ